MNYRNEHIVKVDSYDDFKEQIEKGGFILAHWDGTPETEDRIKEDTKATIRCLPFDADEESLTPGKCMVTGNHLLAVFSLREHIKLRHIYFIFNTLCGVGSSECSRLFLF